MLADNGAAWDNPPERVTWSEARIAEATQLLQSHGHEPLFGFKDPRALLILDGWKSIYPGMEFVGIFRHPNAVARSLEKRSGMPWEKAVKLWFAYNSVLYREYKRKPFPLLNFDDDEATLDKKILGVIAQLGLSRADNDQRFYDSELKNNSDIGPALPWKIRRLHKKLIKAGL